MIATDASVRCICSGKGVPMPREEKIPLMPRPKAMIGLSRPIVSVALTLRYEPGGHATRSSGPWIVFVNDGSSGNGHWVNALSSTLALLPGGVGGAQKTCTATEPASGSAPFSGQFEHGCVVFGSRCAAQVAYVTISFAVRRRVEHTPLAHVEGYCGLYSLRAP